MTTVASAVPRQTAAPDPVVDSFKEGCRRDRQRAKVRTAAVLGTQAAIVGVFLGAWQLAIVTGLADPLFVGTPVGVMRELWIKTVDGTFIEAARPTFVAVVIAFVIASSVGIFVGVLMDEFDFLDRVLQPIVALVNAVPRIALAPMLIVWFGLGTTSKVVLAVSLVVFIQLIATSSSLKNVDEYLILLSRSLGSSRWQRFVNIKLPWALPGIFGGFRLGLVYAVLSVVVSEMIASPDGLGQLIAFYSNTFAIASALAALLFLSIITLGLVQIVNYIEGKLGTWQ